MNWLIVPHVGKTTLKGESNFLLYLDVARFLASAGDIVHLLVDVEAADEELPKIDRVFYLRAKPAVRGLSFYNRTALLPPEVVAECHRRRGCRFIDAVLTSRAGIVQAIKTALSAVDLDMVPVVYLEPGAEDKLRRIKSEGFKRSMAHTWLSADLCVLLTDNEKSVALEQLRTFASGSEVRAFMQRMLVNPVGVPVDAADKYRSSPKHDKFTLFFGARANDVKQLDDVYDVYDRIYRSGRDVRIVFATPSTLPRTLKHIGHGRLKENPNVEFHSQLSRDEYMRLMSGAHAFVAWSKWEGFPVGFWEQMYLGLVGLFPDKPWARSQLPKDYPFFFSTKAECFALLSTVIDRYADAKARVAGMPDLIRERYRKDVVWDSLRSAAQFAASAGQQYRLTDEMQKAIEVGVQALPEQFSFDDLVHYVIQSSRRLPELTDMRAEDFRFPGNYDLFKHAESLGLRYHLLNEGRTLIFEKDKHAAQEEDRDDGSH